MEAASKANNQWYEALMALGAFPALVIRVPDRSVADLSGSLSYPPSKGLRPWAWASGSKSALR